MRQVLQLVCLLFFVAGPVLAQDIKSDTADHYTQLEHKYRLLKDSVGRYAFIPAVSSIMVDHKQIEINLFNSLLTAVKYRDDNNHLQDINGRQSYFYSTLQFTYGISKKTNFNIGIDVNAVWGRLDADESSSALKVFTSKTDNNSKYAGVLRSIAPRIRWRPLKNNYNFTIQSSVNIPLPITDEKKQVLGNNQVYFLLQFLYNQPFTKRIFLFTQLTAQYGFKNSSVSSVFYSPIALYLSYLFPKRTILFALANFLPVFNNGNYNQYTFQAGGGIQYQASHHFLVNAYYSQDVYGRNFSSFNSFNLSLRFITR